MAAKKYLSLEEAAEILGVRNDEVMRLRERGDLRGFADRGTWKFKSDDVEETKRRRQPDSSPDVPLIDDDDVLSERDEDRRGRGNTSDSDVRLILDDDLKSQLTGSSGDVPVFPAKKGSDSDVRLVGAPAAQKKDSDSDVKLIKTRGADSGVKLSDSDSDVRLAGPARSPSDSDSDVRLAAPPGSDSDVKLVEPRRSDRVLDEVPLELDLSDSVLLDDDSGIALQSDSGIRLTGDSSLRLSGESGIQLRRPQDSGILLEGADSGFRVADEEDIAFKLADDSGVKSRGGGQGSKSGVRGKQPSLSDDELELTTPMLLGGGRDDLDRTDPEVPLLMDDDDDDLMPRATRNDETQAETNVILFDEEDEFETAAAGARKKKSSGLSSKELETETFQMDSDDELADEILDASDDSFADDDLEEVFATDDEDFEEGYSEEGMSAADFSTARAVSASAAQADWGGGTVLLLGFSSLLMVGGAWMACDLLSTVFASSGPVYRGPLVEALGGLFK